MSRWMHVSKWEQIDGVEVACPYCNHVELYLGETGRMGLKIKCKKCDEKFKLGEQK